MKEKLMLHSLSLSLSLSEVDTLNRRYHNSPGWRQLKSLPYKKKEFGPAWAEPAE